MGLTIALLIVIFGLLSNVISTWLEPYLSKERRLTIVAFISLFCIIYTCNNQNKEIPTQKNQDMVSERIGKKKRPNFIPHIVTANESVYLICKKYNTTPEELQKLNPNAVSKDKNGKWQIIPYLTINVEDK